MKTLRKTTQQAMKNPKSHFNRINFLSSICLIAICSLFMVSCKTAFYQPSNAYEEKIPSLTPEVNELSIETFFKDGVVQTESKGWYGDGKVSSTSTSTFTKNPQIKYLNDLFIQETYNISEQFGERQGSIVWSIEYYDGDRFGHKLSATFVAITLGAGGFFYLCGVPWSHYKDCIRVKADIYDKGKNLVASYESETKCKKYYQAIWWGYKGSTASIMALHNSLIEAIDDVKSKINENKTVISNQLKK